jgi:hypothetical protein
MNRRLWIALAIAFGLIFSVGSYGYYLDSQKTPEPEFQGFHSEEGQRILREQIENFRAHGASEENIKRLEKLLKE